MTPTRHIHLDPVGGVAGDMFVAALLHAWPERAAELPAVLQAAGLPASVSARLLPYADHGLQGARFVVSDSGDHHHYHTAFRDIRARLERAALSVNVGKRAIAIFTLLAEAEAAVHGVAVDAVEFHEVGAWDSLADIVAAAFLIEALGTVTWSTTPLPLGSGRIRGDHGVLPAPAPATALLLRGLPVQDDGYPGERVTPTGAAIVRQLAPALRLPDDPLILERVGMGFGARRIEDLPNMLRLLVFETAAPWRAEDEVGVLQFEVDDQPAEDLALGLDRLRNLPTVLDVIQTPAIGKRGRLTAQIQVLTRPEALDDVIVHCFDETTTLGLRWQVVRRAVLNRQALTYQRDGRRIGVKLARRPQDGVTAKAELRDVAEAGGQAERARLRQEAERHMLDNRERDHD